MNKTLALIAALGLVVSAPVFAADEGMTDTTAVKADSKEMKADAKADAKETKADAKADAKETKADAKADKKVEKLAPAAGSTTPDSSKN